MPQKPEKNGDKEGFCRFWSQRVQRASSGPLETSCLAQTQVAPYIRDRFSFMTSRSLFVLRWGGEEAGVLIRFSLFLIFSPKENFEMICFVGQTRSPRAV